MAFLKFDDEQQARDAFEKGASLKIHGSPVDVHYARALVGKFHAMFMEYTVLYCFFSQGKTEEVEGRYSEKCWR